MGQKGQRRIYGGDDYRTLATKLSPEELTCISHCAVFDDCAADGDCELQDKVNGILKE